MQLKSAKKTLIFSLSVCLLASSACRGPASPTASGTGPSEAPVSPSTPLNRDPETLVYHLSAEPDTLHPLNSSDAYASRIDGFIYDSLIERDNATLELKPKMAESWEISEDKLQYTFKLRPGIQWQDGKPVTVDDILYSFQQIMNPKVDAPHLRVYFQDVAKAEKIDDLTVRFTYSKPYFKALEIVGGIPIIPKHIYDNGEDFNRHSAARKPVGNGPYRFVEWVTNQRIVLERNENYWDKSRRPAIKKIIFKIMPDETIAFEALKKGDLDLASLTPLQWTKQDSSPEFDSKLAKNQYYTPSYRFIGWNERRPYFQDARVRKALTLLTNRPAIVEKIEYGLGKLISGPFWINGYEYDASIAPLPFDSEAAKKLLTEAGWVDSDGDGIREKDGVKFEFVFLLPSQAGVYESMALMMKKDFEKAGIKMDVQNMEWAAFTRRLNTRDFDAVALAWSLGFEQDPYQIWHSSQADKGSNFIGFKNPEVDQLIAELRQSFDKNQREKIYHRIHAIIASEQPYTFLYSGPALLARDRRFQNVNIYPGGIDILEWKLNIGK